MKTQGRVRESYRQNQQGKHFQQYALAEAHKDAGCQQGARCSGPGCNLRTGKTDKKRGHHA